MKIFKTSFCLISLTIALLTFAETAKRERPDQQSKTRPAADVGLTVMESDMRATLGHDSFSVAVEAGAAMVPPCGGHAQFARNSSMDLEIEEKKSAEPKRLSSRL